MELCESILTQSMPISLSSDSHVAQNIIACRRPGPGIRQPFAVVVSCPAPICATAGPPGSSPFQ